MQYINKTLNQKQGQFLVSTFIKEQWQDGSNQYVNLSYESFQKKEMKELTILEQQGLCCYCMRKLTLEKTTLEHVIPNKTNNTEELQHYLSFGELNNKNIFLWDKANKHTKISTPPFPHFIAYENLVASCDAKIEEKGEIIFQQCCNHKRDKKEIIPIFFKNNASEIIIYEKDGKLTYDDEYESTIKALNLEHKTLVLLRKAWHSICSLYCMQNVNDAVENSSKRNDILDDCNLTTNEKMTLNKKIYWKLFAEYSWFYKYYK